jgi:hypothetical protein
MAANLSLVMARLAALDLWDKQHQKPVFGWAPILFGWMIQSTPDNPPHARVFINGIPWDPSIKIPLDGNSVYAENAGAYARTLNS